VVVVAAMHHVMVDTGWRSLEDLENSLDDIDNNWMNLGKYQLIHNCRSYYVLRPPRVME
jgi:hypothetical protein